MHSFDTGTGPAARNNNWEMLERAFKVKTSSSTPAQIAPQPIPKQNKKIGLKVPKHIRDEVSQAKAESTTALLVLIHEHLVGNG